jgi:hypothetical protein
MLVSWAKAVPPPAASDTAIAAASGVAQIIPRLIQHLTGFTLWRQTYFLITTSVNVAIVVILLVLQVWYSRNAPMTCNTRRYDKRVCVSHVPLLLRTPATNKPSGRCGTSKFIYFQSFIASKFQSF